MSPTEDLADVERVLAGEVSAFEGIVRRWQGPLINMAYRFCNDRSRAEEMAQEAFLRAYRGLAGWRRDAASRSRSRRAPKGDRRIRGKGNSAGRSSTPSRPNASSS